MLRATSLAVWANELHSSLLSGNTLGLGNTALSSRLWGESTSVATCRLVLAHQTVSHLKVRSLPQGFREDISLAWRPLLGVMARNQRLWNKEFTWNYSHVILLQWGYFSEIFEYVFSSLIFLCYILHNWRTHNNNKKICIPFSILKSIFFLFANVYWNLMCIHQQKNSLECKAKKQCVANHATEWINTSLISSWL